MTISSNIQVFLNTSLIDLAEKYNWSSKTFTVCRINRLFNLGTILFKFKKENNFDFLTHFEFMVAHELGVFCRKLLSDKDFNAAVNEAFERSEADSALIDQDISLNALAQCHQFTVDMYHVCYKNGLDDLIRLLVYFKRHRHFLDLVDTDAIANRRLYAFCKALLGEYLPKKSNSDEIKPLNSLNLGDNLSVSIDEIAMHYPMSKRALHTCYKNGLLNLATLLSYFKENENFLKFWYIGARTNKELVDLCLVLLGEEGLDLTFIHKDDEGKQLFFNTDLSPMHKAVVYAMFEREMGKLSKIAQKGIRTSVLEPVTIEKLYRAFHSHDKIPYIKSIREKTAIEISHFVRTIERETERILLLEESNFEARQLVNQLMLLFPLKLSDLEPYTMAIEQKKFPLFNFLDLLLKNPYILDKRQNIILRASSSHYHQTSSTTLLELGKQLDLTRERVRQILIQSDTILLTQLAALTPIKEVLTPCLSYPIDTTQDCIYISESLVETINTKEACAFTNLFVGHVFKGIAPSIYTIYNIKTSHVKQIYLINNDLIQRFNFNAFFDTFSLLARKLTTKTYSMNFETFIQPYFLTENNADIAQRVLHVCQQLVSDQYAEKDILNEAGDTLTFRRTKGLKKADCLEEILKKHGSPMHFETLNNQLKKLYPEFKDSTITSLRGYVNLYSSTFTHFSRGYYGLVVWDNERTDIKSGGIRSIVESYLVQFDEPKHSSDIINHVLKYHPLSNLHSVESNLRLAKDKFKKIGRSYWGLIDREYPAFKANPIPVFFITQIMSYVRHHPDLSEADIVEALTIKNDLKTPQVQSVIDNAIKTGTLKRSNGQLTVKKRTRKKTGKKIRKKAKT